MLTFQSKPEYPKQNIFFLNPTCSQTQNAQTSSPGLPLTIHFTAQVVRDGSLISFRYSYKEGNNIISGEPSIAQGFF